MASRFSALVTLLALFFVCAASPALASKKKKGDGDEFGVYKGYVVIDAATGKTLLSESPNVVSPPASMTKLMTFLVVHDALKAGKIGLDTIVPITREDAKMGGTQVYLDPREQYPVEEMLYAMMIQSANDAASALARLVGGSREAFVEQMNARARELGMSHTRFVSPHGLPPANRREEDGDLTTPADFGILCRELLAKTDVLKYTAVKRRTFGTGQRAEPMQMQNHNNLIGRVVGVDGLKTGYTKAAGYCLSSTAQRNGKRVIVVIMGCFGTGGTVDMGRSRDRKSIELIERGLAAIPADSHFDGPVAPAPHDPNSPVAPAAPGTAKPAEAPLISFPGSR
ncbi:D-alanyl-D-alanine carboxypeptidase family protein [Nibricoccus sp. IMCC34717]|uniref:D-alanyl-D-alanine carboxypeptidase family protein n=1 Tax=Nibricoccus sp. IMCC34717 TaxID=3034021 RepID=UPI00385071B7